jgi:hypothetical protein
MYIHRLYGPLIKSNFLPLYFPCNECPSHHPPPGPPWLPEPSHNLPYPPAPSYQTTPFYTKPFPSKPSPSSSPPRPSHHPLKAPTHLSNSTFCFPIHFFACSPLSSLLLIHSAQKATSGALTPGHLYVSPHLSIPLQNSPKLYLRCE